jgi:hypothetical protein
MIWTAVGSSGAVDEESLGHYGFDDASLGYRPGSFTPAPVIANYNVVNTYRADPGQNPFQPPWHHLELGATAPGDSMVEATLFQVERCTGKTRPLCTVVIQQADNARCDRCRFPDTINFEEFLYYVRVELRRRDREVKPFAHTLRIL